jgi:PAS domain S-box-containing protein
MSEKRTRPTPKQGPHSHSTGTSAAAAVAAAPDGSADERYRHLFERSPIGLYRTTHGDGRILDCNDACAQILGYANRLELIGHKAPEFYFDLRDREQVLRVMNRDRVLRNYELCLRRKDGAPVWVLENVAILRDDDGLEVFEGSLIDITALKRSQERLLVDKSHLEQLFENSPEAIATVGSDLRIQAVNQEFSRIFGYGRSEAVGREINDLIVPIEKQQEGTRLCEQVQAGANFSIETVRRRKDGTTVDVSILGTPIILPGGKQVGHYSIFREITERKHSERLQQALYRIADKASSALDLQELYRSIHSILNELMYAKNCYVALYDEATDMVSFPYFVDEKDPQFPPHRFGKGLTEYILRSGTSLLATPEKLAELTRAGEIERSGSPSLDWMGVPLKSGEKAFGVLAVQSYREHTRYGEHEKEILTFVSSQIARAIENRRNQEAVRESENKFRAMAETAVTAISIHDEERFIYVNPAACKIVGYSQEEMMRMRPFELVTPQFRELAIRRGRARLAGEDVPSRYEFQIATRSGETRWLDFSARSIPFGGRTAMVATAVDITERKRSEQLQSALYRIAERTSAAGDLHEFYAYIHQVVSELMYAKNFYISIFDEETQTLSFPYFVDEEDVQPVRKKLGKGLTEFVLRTGRPLLATPDVFEAMVRAGDVESIGAPSLDWLGVPLIISEKPIGVLVVQTYKENIRYREADKDLLTFVSQHVATAIEHKRNQEELRLSEARYRSLVQSAVYGIFRASMDGKFLAVNPALVTMLGYGSEQELMALSLDDDVFLDPRGRERLLADYERTNRWEGAEVQMKRKDGSTITVRLSGRVAADDGGKQLYTECIAEDITERRALEQQLRQAQKMEAVGRLAGGVAHDFNNLLTVIKGYTELMLADPAPYVHRSELEETMKAADRAASLTRQLLAFSRQQVMAPRILNLNNVVANMQNLLMRLLGEDVHLEISLEEKLHNVKADPSQFEQVIMNLAVNARHAMPKGGRLRIETGNVDLEEDWAREHIGAKPGKYVMLAITDTGTGMDEKTKSRLFEPFFTTKEQGKGTGLGLSTVYGIVKQSDGYIAVYSELGVGTTFKVYLPRVQAPAENVKLSGVFPQANRGNETILLVEDEEGVRRLVRDIVSRQGYKVLEARSGEEALKVAEQHAGNIDLLLTDLVLSQMSGRELSERLRQRLREMKVLYMSGYTDDAMLHSGGLLKGAGFIQKPFTAASLSQKMRELLDETGVTPV